MTDVLGLNSVGEDKTMMFKTFKGPVQIYPCWCEFPSGTFPTGDLSVAPSRGEENDACDTICLYKDTMREDAIEFGDPLANVRAPAQQELRIAERVCAYNDGDMDKIARIDEREEKRRNWKAYHRNVRKYRAGVCKASSSKGR